MRKGYGLIVAAPIFLLGLSAAAPRGGCLAGMRSALIARNFSGPLVCDKTNATFRLVGRAFRSGYVIYDYRYRYMPKNGNVMHGGQRIVIFRRGKYIGQYALSPPPQAAMSMRGDTLIIKTHGFKDVSIDFSKRPPKKVFINGYIDELFL